jgi:hypothetical protein
MTMSAIFNHHNIKPRLADINLSLLVGVYAKEREISIIQLSKNIGRTASYLHHQLAKPDQSISLLLLLSTHLHHNLLEPYQAIIPESCRTTYAEKTLQQQIAALQKELEEVKKERDIYKAIVMK